MSLKTKVAIITGGAQGIGAAIATRFARAGASVVIADVAVPQGEQKAAEIEHAGGQVQFVRTDVADPAHVDALFDTTLKAFGRLDILVNNAAVVHNREANRHILELSEAMWRRVLAVNLDGLFYCSQRAARLMVIQGQGGCIINMSSGGATRAHRQMLAYDTTKGAIEAATRSLALDLALWQIRVNAIVPGNTQVENMQPPGESSVGPVDWIPLGRAGAPEDIANAAAFLASDEASYITGECLFVDGGMNAQLRSPAVDTQIDLSLAETLLAQ